MILATVEFTQFYFTCNKNMRQGRVYTGGSEYPGMGSTWRTLPGKVRSQKLLLDGLRERVHAGDLKE